MHNNAALGGGTISQWQIQVNECNMITAASES